MAIRYSNAGRYMPSRNPAQTGPVRGGGQPGSYGNPPYPGNRGEGDPINGYPPGSTTPGYIDYRDPAVNGPFYPGTTRQEYRDDPNARLIHTPGSSRGQQSGFKPSVSPETPWSWTAEDEANDQAAQAQRRADDDAGWRRRGYAGSDWWKSDPEYQQLLASGNKRGASDRKDSLLMKAKDDIALKAFIAQGGTEEVYRNRFNRDWPKPRSPLGAYSHGPGSADWDTRFTNPPPPNTAGVGGGGVRRGATPTNTSAFVDSAHAPAWTQQGGMPPSANPMMQGYGQGVVSGGQGGQFGQYGGGGYGAGQVYGGQGGQFGQYGGGYNPGQSKSGMGQSRYAYDPSQPAPHGPMMSTGGNTGMYRGDGNPYGRDTGMYDQPMGGGSDLARNLMMQDQYNQQYGGGMGGNMMGYGQNPYMPQGGGMQGGYMPFNGGNFSMPYDQYSGMGYW